MTGYTMEQYQEDEVPEEFDESEGEEENEYYDNEFAQSMPAHLSQSINHPITKKGRQN